MATIGGDWPTLLDVQKRKDPDGGTADIVEMLQQTNEMLMDAPWYEGNLPTGHQVTQRVGLPAVFYRRMNQGVPASKSQVAQITVTASMLEALSKIDERLAKLNGQDWLVSEQSAFAEAMNQQLAETVVYGSVGTVPEEFTGLAVQYSSLTALSGENIIDAGGVGSDNTSAWLINWGQRASYMIYPKGMNGGLKFEDLGRQIARDDAGLEFMSLMGHWSMNPGFCVADWRANVRVANIDVSNLVGETSAADILKLMTIATHKVPKEITGRSAWYVNRTVYAMLDIQAQNKANVYLTIGEEEGRPKISFRGTPIRTMDQILDTEARVT